MLMLVSSGSSVAEVCRAVFLFVNWLEKRYDFEIVKIEYAECKNCYKSVLIRSQDRRLLGLKGTHLWHCQSLFREKHKRKNWYFSFSLQQEFKCAALDESKIVYKTLKSPKRGGQHVNTTNSGVRAIYLPLKIEAISFDERSQHLNKKVAKKRLLEKLDKIDKEREKEAKKSIYSSLKSIQRGQEVLRFVGEEFRVVKS